MPEEQLIVCLADNKNYWEKDKALIDSWPFDCGGCISGPCDDCILQTKPMTRTEAVKRIALALCQRYYGFPDCVNCELKASGDCRLDFMKPQAETALDAMVRGKQI